MTRICLVSCVGQKLDHPARAIDLYISPWFKKARGYATRCDRWYVLSAKYGLVTPDSVIEPYEVTLNKMRKLDRQSWARRVFQALCHVTSGDDEMIVLAGHKYRETLVPLLQQRGNHIDVPMEGMGIGEQLHWLDEQSWRS